MAKAENLQLDQKSPNLFRKDMPSLVFPETSSIVFVENWDQFLETHSISDYYKFL